MNQARRASWGTRVAVAVLAGVCLMTATSIGRASAGHEGDDVPSYTGCLTAGGTLTSIQVGDRPTKPCNPSAVVAHFSGGDITAIVAGTGLTGGGTNGETSIALAPSFQLPQTCAADQVAKWDGSGWSCADDDDGSSYTAGEGLALNGTEFSIKNLYQLPQDCDLGQSPVLAPGLSIQLPEWGCTTPVEADQACPTGEFARAVDASGSLGCAAPSAGPGGGSTAYLAVQRNPANGSEFTGILNNGQKFEMVRLNLPSGTYVLSASGVISAGRGGLIAYCELIANGIIVHEILISTGDDEFHVSESLSLTSVVNLPHGGTVPVMCGTSGDGVTGENFRLVATSVGSLQ